MTAAPPPSPYPPPGYPPQHAPPAGPQPRTSGLAITSLILGALAIPATLFCVGVVLGIVGLILGIIAWVQIGKPGKPEGGKGIAITGTILSGVSFLVIPAAVALMLPSMSAARNSARKAVAMTHVRDINLAVITDATMRPRDANGNRPFADDIGMLVVDAGGIAPDQVLSPFAKQSPPPNFASMSDAAKADWVRFNTAYILVPGLTDAATPRDILVVGVPDAFEGGIPVGYGDGHADWVDDDDLDQFKRDVHTQAGKPLEQLIKDARAGP